MTASAAGRRGGSGEKAELRRALLARRRALSATARAEAAEALCGALRPALSAALHPPLHPGLHPGLHPRLHPGPVSAPGAGSAAPTVRRGPARVASYRALPFEPRPPAVPGALLPVLLPDGDLDWELDGRRQGVEAVATVELVLVPAVAVDRRGVRLGRGGGSYDRALARTSARTVALLHDGELLTALPAETHDVPVGWVVTPSGGLVGLPL